VGNSTFMDVEEPELSHRELEWPVLCPDTNSLAIQQELANGSLSWHIFW